MNHLILSQFILNKITMKRYLYLFLVLVLFSCDDNFEDIHRYRQEVTQTKEYPVYLDMSEIGEIRVKSNSPQESPFKIVSNDNYYFVGDMLKGIHVYQKTAKSIKYLCFIECLYIKDLALIDKQLFCNNFADMVILDVSNPLQTTILHRQKNHFNRFTDYKTIWNIPYIEGKGLVVGTEQHVVSGVVTNENPNLDLSEYDKLYGNLTTKTLPDSWFSEQPEHDKPYVGIIKVGSQIYTYGTYNSWAICTFNSKGFSMKEENLWSKPRGKYAPPYYYANAYPTKMFFEDNIIYVSSESYDSGSFDCITYNEEYPFSFNVYRKNVKPLDITYMPNMNAFFVLWNQSICGAFKHKDPKRNIIENYKNYDRLTAATSIFTIGNHVVTLGKELSVYLPSENDLKLVKIYSDISGICYEKIGNTVVIANTQGLFKYDFNDLKNIKLIP